MTTNTFRSRRRCQPSLISLEDRRVPAVTGTLFLAISPGVLHPGDVSIAGIIGDSDANPITSAGLAATYEVDNSFGIAIASGPLELNPTNISLSNGSSDIVDFSTHIPASVYPGISETIKIIATDVDTTPGRPTIVQTNLVISSVPKATNIRFAGENNNNSTINGTAQGQVSAKFLPDGSIQTSGKGSIIGTVQDSTIGSSSPFTASAQGSFKLSIGAQGAMSLGVKGTGSLQEGNGGFSVGIRGSLQLNRNVAGLYQGVVRGDAQLNVQESGGGTFSLGLRKTYIKINSNGHGGITAVASGKLFLSGTNLLSGTTTLD